MFISYARNFEDVLLRRAFGDVLAGGGGGTYVDFGARDPVLGSVTHGLHEAGWSGLNVAPAECVARLAAARPRDATLALSGAAGRLPDGSGPGGAMPEFPTSGGREPPPAAGTSELADLLAAHLAGRHLHVLRVDAGGAEAAVLRGNDWRRFRPEVVLATAVDPATGGRTDGAWAALLEEAGYRSVWFDGLSRWFLRAESAHRGDAFGAPPNVRDGFRRHEPAGDLARLEASGRERDAALAAARAEVVSLGAVGAALGHELALAEEEVVSLRRELREAGAAVGEARLAVEGQVRAAELAEAARAAMAAQREALVYDLRMPGAPRALLLVLPFARLLRTLLRLGRPLPARTPLAVPGGTDPALARSVEDGLLTLALRPGAPPPG